jgi:hypothetical protein
MRFWRAGCDFDIWKPSLATIRDIETIAGRENIHEEIDFEY